MWWRRRAYGRRTSYQRKKPYYYRQRYTRQRNIRYTVPRDARTLSVKLAYHMVARLTTADNGKTTPASAQYAWRISLSAVFGGTEDITNLLGHYADFEWVKIVYIPMPTTSPTLTQSSTGKQKTAMYNQSDANYGYYVTAYDNETYTDNSNKDIPYSPIELLRFKQSRLVPPFTFSGSKTKHYALTIRPKTLHQCGWHNIRETWTTSYTDNDLGTLFWSDFTEQTITLSPTAAGAANRHYTFLLKVTIRLGNLLPTWNRLHKAAAKEDTAAPIVDFPESPPPPSPNLDDYIMQTPSEW